MILRLPALCLVAGPDDCGGRPIEAVVQAAIDGGITLFQLRDKHHSDAQLVAIAERLLPMLRAAGVPLIVNDRVRLAGRIGADGVHLGPEDAPPCSARRVLGKNALLGLSIKTVDQAASAAALPVDYLGAGAFATPTKSGTSPFGLDGLAELRSVARQPILAIGGVGPANAAEIMATGVDGLAVVSAIAAADDPRAAAHTLRKAME